MQNKPIRLILLVGILVFAEDALANNTSRHIGFCGGVFAYAANYYMMLNNTGAARVMIYQLGRTTATLYYYNYPNHHDNDVGIIESKRSRRLAKPYLDKNLHALNTAIDDCQQYINDLAIKQADKKITIGGFDFYQLTNMVAAEIRKAMGIQ